MDDSIRQLMESFPLTYQAISDLQEGKITFPQFEQKVYDILMGLQLRTSAGTTRPSKHKSTRTLLTKEQESPSANGRRRPSTRQNSQQKLPGHRSR